MKLCFVHLSPFKPFHLNYKTCDLVPPSIDLLYFQTQKGLIHKSWCEIPLFINSNPCQCLHTHTHTHSACQRWFLDIDEWRKGVPVTQQIIIFNDQRSLWPVRAPLLPLSWTVSKLISQQPTAWNKTGKEETGSPLLLSKIPNTHCWSFSDLAVSQ